jgi:hypothetical protein
MLYRETNLIDCKAQNDNRKEIGVFDWFFDWFNNTFDVTLLATIALIFLASLVGAYLRARRRDPCLKSFIGFHVTLEHVDGRLIWGQMSLEATGLELRYKNSIQDDNHVESSYVLYGEEFIDIQAIYRYADELDEESKHRREKDLKKSFHPGLLRRIIRSIRNFISLASDSLSEVVGLLIGGLRRPAGRYISDEGEAHLKSLGSTVVGHAGHGYDPLLENFVGQKMVFEVVEDDEVHEHVGIFKQYSADFIEILDVQFPQKQALTIDVEGVQAARHVRAVLDGGILKVTNESQQPVLLQSLVLGQEEEEFNVVVDSGETVILHPGRSVIGGKLNLRVVRELDMIVPRTRCVVRHRAEFYQTSILPAIIFDLGIMVRGADKMEVKEAQLRTQLAQNPSSAMAIANLGAILMKKQQYDEADRLLRKAWKMRYSLPDNGRRTRLLLQELARKRNEMTALENASTSEQDNEENS